MKWHMPEINGRLRRRARRRRLMRPDLPNLRETPVWSGWGRKPIWMAAIFLLVAVSAVGVVGRPGHAATVLEAPLSLISGENPSKPGLVTEARGRFDDQGRVRIDMTNMDPARYPSGSICQTQIRAGAWTAKNVPLVFNAVTGATELHARTSHPMAAGDKAEVRIRCQSNGQKHETRYQGVFAPK